MQVTDEMVEAALDGADYIPNPDNRLWMRAALTAALAKAWRPIEEAPKDGTWFLAYCDDKDIGQRWFEVIRRTPANGTGGRYGDFVWGTPASIVGHYAEQIPAHWTPLPEPPVTKEGE